MNNIFWKIVFFLNNSSLNIWFILTVFIFIKFNTNKNVIVYSNTLFLLNVFNLSLVELRTFVNNPILNIDLYNGMLIIHPILTYITMVFYSCVFFKNANKFLKKTDLLKINNAKFKLKRLILFSISALVLGSCWAQQELNWGGWWNWDSVEIILLSFNLLILLLIHINDKIKMNNYFNNIFIEKYFYFILFYIVVRTNIITSIHAFSISTNLQKYFYITMLLCSFIFLYLQFNIKYIYKIVFLKKNYFINIFNILSINKIYSTSIFYFTNLLIVLITLLNLFFFLQNIKMSVNLYKYIGVFIKVSVFTFFLFYFKNKKINIFIFCIVLYNVNLILTLSLLSILFFFKKNKFFLKKNHITIILIIFFFIDDFGYYLKTLENVYTFSNVFINSNDFTLSLIQKINYINLFFELNLFFLKNNLNYFLENSLNSSLETGLNLNFFNSNLLNIDGKFLLNYILENQFIFKVDQFLITNTTIIIIFLCVYIYNLFTNLFYTSKMV